MVHHIVLLSSGRSGTNLHQSILEHSLENAVVLREIFNPSCPYGFENVNSEFVTLLEEEGGFEFNPNNARSLANYFREDPIKILDLLSRACDHMGYEYLSYKILPKQISKKAIEDIAFNFDCSCSFLTRNRLARYVSLVKARQLGVWKGVDTTPLKAEITMEDFLTESGTTDDWFQIVSEAALSAGRAVRHLSYGADLNQPASTAFYSLQRKYSGICALSAFDFSLIPEFKQEQETDLFRSISNGTQIRRALESASLREYAFGEPAVFAADGYV